MNNLFYHKNKELTSYNSFKTKAFAQYFIEPQTIDEIKQCIVDFDRKPILILGEGCNLFFTKNFDGLVIKPQLFGIQEIKDQSIEDDEILIEAMASENWDQFVKYCVDRNYSNIENLSLIPGTVGASPVQNIGAYGVEVKDYIQYVKAIDLKTGKTVVLQNKECSFTYRSSLFKQTERYIITSVCFILKKNFEYRPKYADLNNALAHLSNPTVNDVRETVIKIRQNKLPNESELPNAGSFFKNPYLCKSLAEILKVNYPDIPLYPINDDLVKTSAAFLIDKVGLKGIRIGKIGTYPKQPLIVVNYGSEDGNEIVSFMKIIQQKIKDVFGINLEPEVRIL